MTQGTIISYDPHKKCGYVRLATGDDEISFDLDHVIDYSTRGTPEIGQQVEFKVTGGMAGTQVLELRRV